MIVTISNHISFVWLFYTIIINCLIVKYQLIKKRNKPCKIEVKVDVKREETELLFSIIHCEWREATTDDEDTVSPWEDGSWNLADELVGGALNGRDREWWLGEEERGGSGGDVEKRVVARWGGIAKREHTTTTKVSTLDSLCVYVVHIRINLFIFKYLQITPTEMLFYKSCF